MTKKKHTPPSPTGKWNCFYRTAPRAELNCKVVEAWGKEKAERLFWNWAGTTAHYNLRLIRMEAVKEEN